MSLSASQQRQALTQFMQFTQTPERTAKKILQANNWNLELAIDSYYQNPNTPSAPGPTNQAALHAIFDQFKQSTDGPDSISIGGTMSFFEALDLQLDDLTVAALSKALESKAMGEFSRKGFVDGWQTLGADSIPKMKEKISEIRQSMDTDEEYFKKVYLWTFTWALQEGQKSLPLDIAVEWWRMLLQSRFGENGHLDRWIKFLQEKWNKSVPKDTWNMLYEFVLFTKGDPTLAKYDEMASWPSVIDGYVEYYRNQEQ